MDTTIFAELLSFPGNESEAVAVIRNESHEAFTVHAIPSNAPFFVLSADPSFGTPIEPGATLTVTIRFAPDGPGSYARLFMIGPKAVLCEGTWRAGMGENDEEWITTMPPRRSSRSRTTNRSLKSWRGSPGDASPE